MRGSPKRLRELQIAFDSPPRYGKSLDWTGYTAHDAACLLTRYLTTLPEPVIQLDFYEEFRDPLRSTDIQDKVLSEDPSILPGSSLGADTLVTADNHKRLKTYQDIVPRMPPLNR